MLAEGEEPSFEIGSEVVNVRAPAGVGSREVSFRIEWSKSHWGTPGTLGLLAANGNNRLILIVYYYYIKREYQLPHAKNNLGREETTSQKHGIEDGERRRDGVHVRSKTGPNSERTRWTEGLTPAPWCRPPPDSPPGRPHLLPVLAAGLGGERARASTRP